jgi:hypothetical protein
MAKFKLGDKVKVADRPVWLDGYKIANMIGTVVEVKANPPGYIIMKADKTGYNMAFYENELEKAS